MDVISAKPRNSLISKDLYLMKNKSQSFIRRLWKGKKEYNRKRASSQRWNELRLFYLVVWILRNELSHETSRNRSEPAESCKNLCVIIRD